MKTEMHGAPVEAYIALGSNQGDRDAHLRGALDAIAALAGTRLERVSEFISTEAEGFEGEEFLNGCCKITTTLQPQALLEALKGIERAHGRCNEGIKLDDTGCRVYSDRPLDLDILLYGDKTINTETLQIPHPRMYERDFVMIPLRQIKD